MNSPLSDRESVSVEKITILDMWETAAIVEIEWQSDLACNF